MGDIHDLEEFLGRVDLTASGLDSPTARLWIERDPTGAIVASAGYELSADGVHVLIRSVAVTPRLRSGGRGAEAARFALHQASQEGVRRAWLFSRRSGPFWQSLGFLPAARDDLAVALAGTEQVRPFHARASSSARSHGHANRASEAFEPMRQPSTRH